MRTVLAIDATWGRGQVYSAHGAEPYLLTDAGVLQRLAFTPGPFRHHVVVPEPYQAPEERARLLVLGWAGVHIDGGPLDHPTGAFEGLGM